MKINQAGCSGGCVMGVDIWRGVKYGVKEEVGDGTEGKQVWSWVCVKCR